MNTVLKPKTHCLIMAGGKGLRFWPVSREKKPKQLQKLFFDKTLLEQTIDRVSFIDNICISTNKTIANKVKKIHSNIITEPASRNTAPSILYSCFKLQSNIDDIMVVLPSDQYINEKKTFIKTITKALAFVKKQNYIVCIGIKPNSAHTGYGYIKKGKLLEKDLFLIDSFKEKPDLFTAEKYFKSDNYFWNAGIFIFKISTILEAFKNTCSDLYKSVYDIYKKDNYNYFVNNYKKLPSISIDYAVLEKIKNIAFIKASFTWDDLGSFKTLENYHDKYAFGTSNSQLVSNIDSKNIAINQYNKNKLSAFIDIEDLLIVDTKDVLFISKKESVNKVKDLIENLKYKKLKKFL